MHAYCISFLYKSYLLLIGSLSHVLLTSSAMAGEIFLFCEIISWVSHKNKPKPAKSPLSFISTFILFIVHHLHYRIESSCFFVFSLPLPTGYTQFTLMVFIIPLGNTNSFSILL